MPTLDFWFDFASTYAYPAAMRIGPLAAEAGVTVRFRPFLLGPIFKAQGWDTSPFNVSEAKGRHMWRDLERLCADLALPFRRPQPFPQASLLPARVALIGFEAGWCEAFCRAVFHAEFAEGRRIDDAAVIGGILEGLNLGAQAILEAAQTDGNKHQLRRQTDEAPRLGIFGSPTFIASDGELFWGNDRLERAVRWAQRGR
ncbi:MAG: 2-hydroxychromene-2-carboxylate isomerase [Xanthobacteraceae bacterium]|nr:2-hydroxychromene-2-carboxylate isomerase [Xanthobacteraceae bacterium]